MWALGTDGVEDTSVGRKNHYREGSIEVDECIEHWETCLEVVHSESLVPVLAHEFSFDAEVCEVGQLLRFEHKIQTHVVAIKQLVGFRSILS